MIGALSDPAICAALDRKGAAAAFWKHHEGRAL
jgi:hypothetical protein